MVRKTLLERIAGIAAAPGRGEWVALDRAAGAELEACWLAAFAPGGRRAAQYRWHTFSAGLAPALEKAAAYEAYAKCRGDFLVFDERGRLHLACRGNSAPLPRLADGLFEDLYVCDEACRWTMVFTHEQPYIGPFFIGRAPSTRG